MPTVLVQSFIGDPLVAAGEFAGVRVRLNDRETLGFKTSAGTHDYLAMLAAMMGKRWPGITFEYDLHSSR